MDPEPNAQLVDELTLRLKEKSPVLPISKVKRIAKTDPEYILTSNSAFVATAFATEIFVKSLTEETLAIAQLNNRTSSNAVGNGKTKRLTYNDMSECVSRNEKFMFLEDMVPKTKNLKTLVKNNKVRYTIAMPTVAQHGDPDVTNAVKEDQEEEEHNEEELARANLTSQLDEIAKLDHVEDLDAVDDPSQHQEYHGTNHGTNSGADEVDSD